MRHLLVNEPFYERAYKYSDPITELRLLSSRGGLSDVSGVINNAFFAKKIDAGVGQAK